MVFGDNTMEFDRDRIHERIYENPGQFMSLEDITLGKRGLRGCCGRCPNSRYVEYYDAA